MLIQPSQSITPFVRSGKPPRRTGAWKEAALLGKVILTADQ
jgi:hypothetical protein